MNILLIEDDTNVAAFIKKGLEEHGYAVSVANEGKSGVSETLQHDFDLIILDIILPGSDGFAVCKEIRRNKKEIPILMLTALGTIGNKVEGFESGADDYLTKPFHFEELLARIRALVRRNIERTDKIYKADDLIVDNGTGAVSRKGKEIVLTSKEFTLLEFLILNKNRILSRREIAEAVWGINFDTGTNVIDVYINYLRAKIDKNHSNKLIQTVIGRGYVLKDK